MTFHAASDELAAVAASLRDALPQRVEREQLSHGSQSRGYIAFSLKTVSV